jgi:hypothetical protein
MICFERIEEAPKGMRLSRFSKLPGGRLRLLVVEACLAATIHAGGRARFFPRLIARRSIP